MNITRPEKGVVRGLALLAAALTLAGCATARRTALKQATTASAGAIAAGDRGKALDLYQKLYEKDRANGKVVSRYAAVIEEVKAFADQAENEDSYAAAQGAYRLLADRWDGFSALAPRLSFRKAELEASAKDCRLALAERQFRQEIVAGDHAKALAAYQSALKDYPQDMNMKARYLKGVAEISGIAAEALGSGNYALAGQLNGLLLKHADSFAAAGDAAVAGGGVPTRSSLADALKACSTGLTNVGLAEYRKGNLESAIALWNGILAFDPGNTEIRKAVETTKAQLGKLKGSGRAGSRAARSGRGAETVR
jgi:tetratricopeptide (TPR) repeat protein